MEDADFVADSDDEQQSDAALQRQSAGAYAAAPPATAAETSPRRLQDWQQQQRVDLLDPNEQQEIPMQLGDSGDESLLEGQDRVGASVYMANASQVEKTMDAENPGRQRVFQVGDLVEVESRTWPGINKPGGSGRIVSVRKETNATGGEEIFYDVRYVLGGYERRIESEYVELSHILQLERVQGRVRYERVFYHDEFADDLHKKKKVQVFENGDESHTSGRDPALVPDTSEGRALSSDAQEQIRARKLKRKKNSTRRRSSESEKHRQKSSETSSNRVLEKDSDDDDDELVAVRRIGDTTFLMDSSSPSSDAETEQAKTGHNGDERNRAERKRRRRRRIIESDEDTSEGNERYETHVPSSPREVQVRRVDRTVRVRATKRRRYVGGYLHGGDDADSTFIQPEDNANALPDDVVREIGFKLGKSKAELKTQLATIASLLKGNLRKFNDQKAIIDQKSKRASTLSIEELREFYRQTSELAGVLTQNLIRGGEDVMNAIILKLTRKGGSLPDSVELVFDDQKREISEHGVWIRKVQSALETAFKVRGERLPSFGEKRHDRVDRASDFDQSEEDDYHGASDFSVANDDDFYHSPKRSSPGKRSREHTSKHDGTTRISAKHFLAATSSRGASRKSTQNIDAFLGRDGSSRRTSSERHFSKGKYATSSSLDDFDFVQYSSEKQRNRLLHAEPLKHDVLFKTTNFRFTSKKRPMAPSDPRWNWLKIGNQKQQQLRAANSKRPSFFHPPSKGSGSAHLMAGSRHSLPKKRQEDLIGSVQNARLQLRDKRFQDPRSSSSSASVAGGFTRNYGYEPPRGTQFERSAYTAGGQRLVSEKRGMGDHYTPVALSYEIGSTRSHPRGGVTQYLSSAPSGPPINWKSVFDVLAGGGMNGLGDAFPAISSTRRQSLMLCGFARCSCGLHRSATSSVRIDHDDDDDGDDEDWVRRFTSRLRQNLNGLRLQESDCMNSLSSGSTPSEATTSDEASYTESSEWKALVETCDQYHSSLARLASQVVDILQERPATTTTLSTFVRAVVVEISRILGQLPDCESLFSGCPSYVYFFEVADRSAKTTPLLTALARTYWCCIQLLIELKAHTSVVADDNKSVESAVESILPVNRAILAASLFLVDLYLYLPSSYRLDQADASAATGEEEVGDANLTDESIPAISLWLLLYDCFASGKCSFQAGKLSASGDGRDFWAFLQTMYRDHFVDHLAIAFIREKSCGGYLFDHIPTISKQQDVAEETAEGQLLALQSVWDLCILFSMIFPRAETSERDDAISEARWAVVKDLLQPGMHAFLPFASSAAVQSQSRDDYTVYSDDFKLHVLQKVFVLSKLSVPQSDVVERILEELWDDTTTTTCSPVHPNEVVELTPFWHQLLHHATNFGNLAEFVNAQQWHSGDQTEMISGIILVQILKFGKAIHRNRFRQPICRAISARYEATRMEVPQPSPAVVEIAASSKSAGVTNKPNAWNWGASSASDTNKPLKNGGDQPATTKLVPQSPVKRGRDEERLMVSILLALAVSSICQDLGAIPFPSSLLRDPSQRANKSLKRDLEFYYKEMSRVVDGDPAHSVLLSQALYVMGRLAMEHSNEYPILFSYLNEQLSSAVQALRVHRNTLADKDVATATASAMKKQTRVLERGVLSPLYLMRDLTKRLCRILPTIAEPVSSSSYALDAVRTSLSFILNTGLESCLDAAVDELLPIDALNAVLEILQCVLPRAADEPTQHLQVMAVESPAAAPSAAAETGEFDEFDDDVWAHVDLDTLTATGASSQAPPSPAATVKQASAATFRETVVQNSLSVLRLGIQRVVIKYPRRGLVSYQELYAIEVLGLLISTSSFQFSWSLVSASSLKPRVLAPRLFSAILKYHPEKEWFSTCFLSEQGADQELANIWLMGTLDLQALFPSLCTLQKSNSSGEFTFPTMVREGDDEPTGKTGSQDQIRYSNYWVMLTDGIIYNLLRENPIAQYKMDPLLLQLLRSTARKSKFAHILRDHGSNSNGSTAIPPSDLPTLYELHLDMFQEFCRSAGQLWRTLAANPMQHRQDMNRFRMKMMDIKSGVFATFPEAYEINLKMVCNDLDRSRHNWYALSEQFLADFTGATSATTNYHSIDESLELVHGQRLKDPTIRILIVLFKFMYGCVDTFLYHCGPMAIGQQNIFFSVMKLMFRQATCAEFPQAENRLLQLQQLDSQETRWFEASVFDASAQSQQQQHKSGAKTSPACLGFVESVRLFFARQKYPSLIHWFSQTLETYQTVKRGWSSSPLRKLLLNVLDPHGPLGIHSYYPIDAGGRMQQQEQQQHRREFDVRQVRREAFYLSCGLFFCRCTATYEHSRSSRSASSAAHPPEAHARLRTLRRFILKEFVWESLDYAGSVDRVCLQETMVPLCQFIRGVLSHGNMNLMALRDNGEDRSRDFDFQVQEVYACLERILTYCIKTFQADQTLLQNSISCVLVLELCGILEEMVSLNDQRFDKEMSTLLELGVAYFKDIFVALGTTSSNPLEPLFVLTSTPTTSELLASFAPIANSIKMEPTVKHEGSPSPSSFDEYGISRLRVKADLFVSIGRLVERCRHSSDLRLRRFVIAE